MEKLKRYRNQDREDLNNNIYMGHLSAMTGEDLHSKSEIAQELAIRDMRVEQLEKENAELRKQIKDLKWAIFNLNNDIEAMLDDPGNLV